MIIIPLLVDSLVTYQLVGRVPHGKSLLETCLYASRTSPVVNGFRIVTPKCSFKNKVRHLKLGI